MSILKYYPAAVSSPHKEATLLALARNGGSPFEQPSPEDFQRLIENINNQQILVHIPWFWRHCFVSEFSVKHVERLDIDSLFGVIIDTEKKCANRELHWVEKVNLFHLYGLCRIAGVEPPRDSVIYNPSDNNALSLSSLSAQNSRLIVNGADAKDAVRSIQYMKANGISRAFAEYQLFYYGGFEVLIDKLSEYVETPKESVIPTTLYALSETFDIDRDSMVDVHDRVLDRMSDSVRKLIVK